MAASAEHSPQHMSSAVGYQFVRQYYTVLNKDPAKLHCFYKKNSLFTHGDEGDQNSDPAAGQIAINSEITALKFQNCKVAVSQLDTQPSANDGVIIMVLGSMSNNNGADRKFAQTFFLISEEPGRYYVLNDLFRFLIEPTNPEPAVAHFEHAPALSQVEHVQVAEPVVESPPAVSHPAVNAEAFEEPIHAPAPVVHEAPAPVVHEVPVPEPAPVEVQQPAPVAVAPPVATPAQIPARVQPPAQTPAAPKAKPTSWASAAAAPPAPKAAAPAATPKPAAAAAAAPAAAPAVVSTTPAAAAPSNESTQEHVKQEKTERPDRRAPIDHDHDNSVFVNNITQDMEAALKVAFSHFGPVKQVAILKNNASAFIDYSSHEHAEAAISAGTITLADGKTVKAEKRTRPRTGNSGSGSGSGSGFGSGQGKRPQHTGPPREPRENGAPRRREENGAPRRDDRPPRKDAPPAGGARKPAAAQAPQPPRQK